MAYNILKGSVEGSVDQHGDQKIDGVKVFKNTISASVFYDTDAQSPCATMKDVAIKKINGGSKNSVLVLGENSEAKAPHDFKYDNGTLTVKHIKAQSIKGSAENMSRIPSNKFIDKIQAGSILLGNGLQDTRGSVQVKTGEGLKSNEDGISLNIEPSSCLSTISNRLTINPSNATTINSEGQNISEVDLLMVYDVSRNTITNTTLKNLFNSYINKKVPHAHGKEGYLQFKGTKEFESSSDLAYEKNNKVLTVNGRITTQSVVSQVKTVNEGSVYCNIIKTDEKLYDVKASDYSIICDASNNPVNVKLPPAHNHRGRILIIKKSNTDKYKINSNVVNVLCDEGRIDINNKIEIKMNFSTRTVQSDGENWWIIGSKGS